MTVDEIAERVAELVAEKLYPYHLQHLPDSALLTAADARALLGISRSRWYRLRNEGKLPLARVTPAGERWRKGDLLRECG